MKGKIQPDKPVKKIIKKLPAVKTKQSRPLPVIEKPIDELLSLSQKIESNFDLNNFPKLAYEILDEFTFDHSFEEFEQAIANWLLELPKLPPQVNLYNVFGEPSISLFNNGKFSVDVYFWRKNDTLIHSHGFRGAFKVLYGNSLHEEFNVETTDDLARKSTSADLFTSDVLSSKVDKIKFEILKRGDTRTIKPAMSLVHRVLHLDNPTVTLCIRTVNDTELSQWHHLSSGISYRQCNIDELTIKRILYFQFLLESNPESAKNYLNHLLGLISVASQLALYEGIYNDEFGLSPETSFYILEQMRVRFEDLKWFSQYEDHYKNMSTSLFETEASSGPLKLLAHAINGNYSPDEIVSLLRTLGEKLTFSEDIKEGYMFETLFEAKSLSVYEDLKALTQLLFNEENIFNEEHYELQQNVIIEFAKKIVNNEKLKKEIYES